MSKSFLAVMIGRDHRFNALSDPPEFGAREHTRCSQWDMMALIDVIHWSRVAYITFHPFLSKEDQKDGATVPMP